MAASEHTAIRSLIDGCVLLALAISQENLTQERSQENAESKQPSKAAK